MKSSVFLKQYRFYFFSLFVMTVMVSQSAAVTAPTSRDPLKWPFAKTSIWNMPIHNNATYVAAGMGAPTAWGMTNDEDIIIMTPTAPLTRVLVNGWTANQRCSGTNQLLNFSIPIPNDFLVPVQGGTPNYASGILREDGRTIVSIQSFQRCVAGGPAYSFVRYPDEDIYGDGEEGAHGGSGLSSVGGSIRMGELVPGSVIRHAIKMNNYCQPYTAYNRNDGTPGYRWPATKADGYASSVYGGQVPALEMGALLAVKPDFNINGMLTEPGKILARAFMDYGAYLVDDTYWDVVAIELANGPDGNVEDQFQSVWGFPYGPQSTSGNWARDIANIVTHLYVIDNNTRTTIGGGANTDTLNRRAPMAPPFTGATTVVPLSNVVKKAGIPVAFRAFTINGTVIAAGKWQGDATPISAAGRGVYLVQTFDVHGATVAAMHVTVR